MKYKHYLVITTLLLCVIYNNLLAIPSAISTDNATIKITANGSKRFGHTTTFLGTLVKEESPFYAITEPLNTANGSIYIFQSSTFSADKTSTDAIITLTGSGGDDEFGLYIAGNGDVDGDGISDFIVASPGSNEIKLYLGKGYATGTNTWNPSFIKTYSSSFLTIHGDGDQKTVASAISMSGDLNGDGFDDIVIGAPKSNGASNSGGRVYIIFGNTTLPTSSSLDSVANKIITGTQASDQVGYSVSIIPDTNQDGYDDLLIGNYDVEITDFGYQAYLIYGTYTNFSNISTVSDADAIFYSKSTNNDGSDWFSETVAGIGDINDDGYGDFAIGAPNANSSSGSIYLYLGEEAKRNHTQAGVDYPIEISAGGSYLLGLHGISGGYDYTGDGIADLLINDPIQNTGTESSYILAGNKNGFSSSLNLEFDATFKITHGTSSDHYFSFSAASGSDISNDGISDLLIGSNILEEAYLFELVTNNRIATMNPSQLESLKVFSDENYTTESTSFKIGDWIYVQAIDTEALDDPQPGTANLLALRVSQNITSTASLQIQAVETNINSGIFRDKFKLVGTRTNEFVSQFRTKKDQSITIESPFNTGFNTSLTVENSTPTISQIIANQVGTGFQDTSIEISYFLQDMDNDIVTIIPEYSLNDENNWQHFEQKSEVSTINSIQAHDLGELRNTAQTKITWSNLSSIDDTINIRIQVGDGTNTSNMILLPPLKIDNTAPVRPSFEPSTSQRVSVIKYSPFVIITANAEAESLVSLYTNKIENSTITANASSNGLVTFNIEIDGNKGSTQEIHLKATDKIGLTSGWSNTLFIELNDIDLTFDSPFNATANITYGVTQNEILSLALKPFIPNTAVTGYTHKAGISLIGNNQSTGLWDTQIPITITFPETLTTTENINVFYFNPTLQEWEIQTNISVTSLSKTTISFLAPSLGNYSVSQHNFPNSPTATHLKINNEFIKENDYYPSSFTISSTLSDDASLSTYILTIQSNETSTNQQQSEQNINLSSTDINFSVTNLPNGTYTIKLIIIDEHNNQTEESYTIKIDTSKIIFKNLSGPNPFNPLQGSLVIGTTLSAPADKFSIIIVDQAGNSIWEHHQENVLGGYFTTEWNGYNSSGNIVPNGIYYAFCLIKKNSTIHKERLVIAILK